MRGAKVRAARESQGNEGNVRVFAAQIDGRHKKEKKKKKNGLWTAYRVEGKGREGRERARLPRYPSIASCLVHSQTPYP